MPAVAVTPVPPLLHGSEDHGAHILGVKQYRQIGRLLDSERGGDTTSGTTPPNTQRHIPEYS